MPQIVNVQEFLTREIARVFSISQEYVAQMIARTAGRTHQEEWDFWHPGTDEERDLFYRMSRSYLFANAKHKIKPEWVRMIAPDSTILDFGGGAGGFTFGVQHLALAVDYFDISIIQSIFVEAVARHHDLPINVLRKWPPWGGGGQRYDVVLASDVFEHIAGYNRYLLDIGAMMKPGAKLFVTAPFGSSGPHLPDSHGFAQVCVAAGLTRRSEELYEKEAP